MSSTTQVEDEMMLLSSFLGCEISDQDCNPEHGEVENTPDPKPKRRRRRAKREGDLEAKKRKLSEEQVSFLETSFVKEKKLECGRKVHLATEAGLDPKQVAVWFQNKRARWKSKQLEEEYLKLKSEHQTATVDKCRLQAEVMKLKEQVSQAEAKITVLSSGAGNVLYSGGGGRGGVLEPISSPNTSVSVHTNHIQPLARDEFGYMDGYNYANILDWVDFYGL